MPGVHASKPAPSNDVPSVQNTTGARDDDEWPADSSWYLTPYSSTSQPRVHQRDLARTLAHTPRVRH